MINRKKIIYMTITLFLVPFVSFLIIVFGILISRSILLQMFVSILCVLLIAYIWIKFRRII